jgi:hypothetical protein
MSDYLVVYNSYYRRCFMISELFEYSPFCGRVIAMMPTSVALIKAGIAKCS